MDKFDSLSVWIVLDAVDKESDDVQAKTHDESSIHILLPFGFYQITNLCKSLSPVLDVCLLYFVIDLVPVQTLLFGCLLSQMVHDKLFAPQQFLDMSVYALDESLVDLVPGCFLVLRPHEYSVNIFSYIFKSGLSQFLVLTYL